MPAPRRVAILQSNYIPWKGYFDIIAAVDEFILLDDVQYTHRDWRNRNIVKTQGGKQWLSVPVRHDRSSRILDVTIATDQGDWVAKHLGTIEHSYGKAPYAGEVLPLLKDLYAQAGSATHLSHVNRGLIEGLQAYMGISTRVTWSTDYLTLGESDALTPTNRLVTLCVRAGATTYLSGPAAQAYMDVEAFTSKRVGVEWMDYEGYEEYPQLYGDFDHHVSVIDLLFMTGKDAPSFLKYAPKPRSETVGRT
jgi:hypothetical protein